MSLVQPVTHLLFAVLTFGLWWRLRGRPDPWLGWLHGGVLMAGSLLVAAIRTRWWGITLFGFLDVIATALLIYLPALWLGTAISWRRSRPRAAATFGGVGLFGALCGLDATVIEPRWLEIVHHTIPVDGPAVRIALVADLQTDEVGDWEAGIFQAIRDAEPDLVLFSGDYIQLYDAEAYAREIQALHALVATLDPPLGGFAVSGDIDPPEVWKEAFEGTRIQVLEDSEVQVGGLNLTGLTVKTSHDGGLLATPREGPKILLGHSPDYSLHETGADLLLAGHTHGGQVVVPFYGPPITFSRVPRSQAGGGSFLREDGSYLVVSRGLGLERMDAPRVRFLCRPELTLIDLVPR